MLSSKATRPDMEAELTERRPPLIDFVSHLNLIALYVRSKPA